MLSEDVASAMNGIFRKMLASGQLREYGPCPQCGATMMAFYDRKHDKPRSLPACPECGYKQTKGAVPQTTSEINKLSMIAARKDAVNYLLNSSIFSDKTVVEKDFANYKIHNSKQSDARQVAQQVVQDVLSGDPVNAMFTGPTGTGKTHLAMASMYDILERSNYQKKCVFVNYRTLLDKVKQSFSDIQSRNQFSDLISNQLAEADVVIVDDLGSETGADNGGYQATSFDINLITGIYDSRVGKCTITTTNLKGADLRKMYGSRVISRITQFSKGHIYDFDGIPDQRMMEAQS